MSISFDRAIKRFLHVAGAFLDGGTVSGLQAANTSDNLYFFEVSYQGESIGPGLGSAYRRESQIEFGLLPQASGAQWDISNDPSISGLPSGQSSIVKTEMISVYDDGVLLCGEEGELDCNDNGISDMDEIADGSVMDIDGNGIPDGCDPDCDNDGEPDAYEIQQRAGDCDSDGTPDVCQQSSDCDGNGVSDNCDIAEGVVADCNGNGIPDSCDISEGQSDDIESDGVPDECQIDGLIWNFRIEDQWANGFTGGLEILNNSGESISDWTLEFDVPYQLTGLWPVGSDLWTQDARGHVIIQCEAWNSDIPDGASVEIGFQADSTPGSPSGVLLNGVEVEAGP